MSLDFDAIDEGLRKFFGLLGRLMLMLIGFAASIMFFVGFTLGWFDDEGEFTFATLRFSVQLSVFVGLAAVSFYGAVARRRRLWPSLLWFILPAVAMNVFLVGHRLLTLR